jgi:hypothetical protein
MFLSLQEDIIAITSIIYAYNAGQMQGFESRR